MAADRAPREVVVARYLGLLGAGIAAASVFLPWASGTLGGITATQTGIHTIDGVVVLVLVVATAGLLYGRGFDERIAGVAGGVCVLVGAYNFVDPLDVKVQARRATGPNAQPELGVVLTALGGLLLLAAVLVASRAGSP